jgi:hypothetical protein
VKEPTLLSKSRFSSLWANLPSYSFVDRLFDVFAARQRIRLIVAGKDHMEFRILWGVFEFSKGSKQEFVIEGGPGFCEAALRSLEDSKAIVTIISRQLLNSGKR